MFRWFMFLFPGFIFGWMLPIFWDWIAPLSFSIMKWLCTSWNFWFVGHGYSIYIMFSLLPILQKPWLIGLYRLKFTHIFSLFTFCWSCIVCSLQGLTLLLAMILKALGPHQYYDSDDDYIPERVSLLNHPTPYVVGDPIYGSKNDAWNIRINNKVKVFNSFKLLFVVQGICVS